MVRWSMWMLHTSLERSKISYWLSLSFNKLLILIEVFSKQYPFILKLWLILLYYLSNSIANLILAKYQVIKKELWAMLLVPIPHIIYLHFNYTKRNESNSFNPSAWISLFFHGWLLKNPSYLCVLKLLDERIT